MGHVMVRTVYFYLDDRRVLRPKSGERYGLLGRWQAVSCDGFRGTRAPEATGLHNWWLIFQEMTLVKD